MERRSLSNNNLTDQRVGGKAIKDYNNSNQNESKLKDSWNYGSCHSYGADYLGGFSWPPRSYTCSFCKREFRSAQALGGHMNVHRRDRARLRQTPPPRDGQFPILNINPNANPNPNFCSPSLASPSFTCTLPSLVSPSLSSLSSSSASPSEIKKWGTTANPTPVEHLSPKGTDLTKVKSAKSLFGIEDFDGLTQENGYKFLKRAEIVRLDLEIGMLSDNPKEDLDLELRLGYS